MNKTLTVTLALAAGFFGSLVTRYIAPPPTFAQDKAPVAKEIRAESFTLVDSSGRAVGTFAPELPRRGSASTGPRIVLRDSFGREIWSAGGSGFRPASEK